ncbi:MAG: cyclic nucleotide-binding domain-containing protein [Deltaproteobacteria bacterium]|nr:cyclic nucleotide-binding domain-containing protein [Deltaproteobacteria bacterium]
MGAPTDISFSAATDVGRKRAHNEDNFLVDSDLGLYVVADGMGGHAAGEVASALAVRTIHEVLAEKSDVLGETLDGDAGTSERRLQRMLGLLEVAVNSASMRIHTEGAADSRKRGMGTTVSMVLVRGGHAFVAHVGDSRIYLLRDGAVRQVTDDHTVAKELIRLGMITPDQLHAIPKKNAITRAVGVYPHVQVDTLSFEVLPGDCFLLCSDGLAGYLDDADEPLGPYLVNDDLEASVRDLIAFANAAGGKDNITAVIVRVGGEGADQLRARRIALKREVLAALPLFGRLNERQLMGIMSVAEVQSFAAGQVVVRHGDPGDGMYVVLAGRLEIERGGATLGELGPGEQFGEMALIRTNPRSATVTTLVDSELVLIRRDDFFDFIRNDAEGAVKLLWQFINVIADRLDRASEELASMRLNQGAAEPVTLAPVSDAAPTKSEDPFSAPTRAGFQVADLPIHRVSVSPPDEPDDDLPLPEPPAPDAVLAATPQAPRVRREVVEEDEERPTRIFGPPLAERRSMPPVPGASLPSPAPEIPFVDEVTPPVAMPRVPTTRRAQRPTNPGSPEALRRQEPAPTESPDASSGEVSFLAAHDASPTAGGTMPSFGNERGLTRKTGPGATLRMGHPESEGDPGFRPTKKTVRLDIESEMGESLEHMRRKFRERLASDRAKEAQRAEATRPPEGEDPVENPALATESVRKPSQ